MGIADRVPGMRPDRTGWNIAVGLLYPTLVVALFLFSPLLVGAAAVVNYRGTADRLARLPGVSAGGSLTSGAAAGTYALILVAFVFGAAGAGETPTDPSTTDPPTTTLNHSTPAPADSSPKSATTNTTPSTTTSSTDTKTTTTTQERTTTTTSTSTTSTTPPPSTTTTTTSTISSTTAETTAVTTATTTVSTTTATATSTVSSTTARTTAVTTSSTTTASTTTPTATTTTSTTTVRTTTVSRTTTETTTVATTTSSADSGELTATVHEVVDGDTLEVRYSNGSTDTVRLLGVDTPEVHTGVSPDEFEGIPDSEAGREWLSDWGDNASSYSKRVVAGKQVTLVLDEESDRRGSFGRLLAYVRVNSTYQLNYELVDEGYARVYDSTFTQSNRFYDAEADAQANNIGVWGFESPTTTTTTSDQSGSGDLAVVTIHEDAAGDEYDNLNDEYVTFENTGSETLSLGGWTVSDEANHDYTFPSGFELDPGDQVTLHTGIGTDTENELYWGMQAPVWNNNGDTVFVHDASGELVVEESYS